MLEIKAALTAARGLVDLAKTAIDARDDAKVRNALADLEMRLHDATSAALAMSEKAAALEAALRTAEHVKAELQAKIRERETYRPHELRPGAFVYASQPVDEGLRTPQHYLCQPCYDKGVKAVLRLLPASPGLDAQWLCPEQATHSITLHGTAQRISSRSRRGDD